MSRAFGARSRISQEYSWIRPWMQQYKNVYNACGELLYFSLNIAALVFWQCSHVYWFKNYLNSLNGEDRGFVWLTHYKTVYQSAIICDNEQEVKINREFSVQRDANGTIFRQIERQIVAIWNSHWFHLVLSNSHACLCNWRNQEKAGEFLLSPDKPLQV